MKKKNKWMLVPKQSPLEWIGQALVTSMVLAVWTKTKRIPKSLRLNSFNEKTNEINFDFK